MAVTHLLYLHGFRSSPQSTKARQVAARVAQRHPRVTWWCPQLPPSPKAAMDMVMQGIAAWPRPHMAVIGSSLGGFYATCVAEATGCKAVLLNPAVHPARDLAKYIGEQTAWHDPGEHFFFEPHFVDELRALESAPARAPGELLRGDRQGRRGAGLARDDRPLSGRPDQAAGRQRPCAVGLRQPHRGSVRFPRSGLKHLHGTIDPMFALFEEAGKFQAGRVLSEAESSAQVELDSGKRVKVKAANILLKFEKPSPAELMREAQALAQTIELELAWEFAPAGGIRLRRPGARLFQREGHAGAAGGGAASPVRGAALLPPRRQGPLQEGARRNPAAGAGRDREEEAGPGPDRSLGRGTGRRQLPRAHPRAAVQDPVQAGQERARIQGRGRSFARHAHRAAGPAANTPARSPRPTSSTGSASCSRTSPRAPAFPPLQAPAIKDELPLADVQAFSIDDSSTTEIDDALSVQGLGTRHGDGGHPHRRAGPGAAAGERHRPGGAPAPVHGLHAGLQDHHAARRRGAGLHPAGRPRLPRGVAVRAPSTKPRWRSRTRETRLERVPIAANLRHDQLDAVVTEAWLQEPAAGNRGRAAAVGASHRSCPSCTAWPCT